MNKISRLKMNKTGSRYEVSFDDGDDPNRVEEVWADSKDQAIEEIKMDWSQDIIIKTVKKLF